MRGTSLDPEKVPPKWLPRVRGLGEKADSQRVHRLKCRRLAASSLLTTRYRKVELQQHCLPCREYRDTKLSRKLPSAPITGMSAMEGETRKRPLSAWEELKHQPWLGWGGGGGVPPLLRHPANPLLRRPQTHPGPRLNLVSSKPRAACFAVGNSPS